MPYSPDWEKEMMDKFCVMFERVHRDDGESGDEWVTKMEDFIRSLLQAREEWLRGEIEGIKTSKEYNAMVKNGDLSFLNYTPTQIYTKALDTILALFTPKN